MYIEVEIGSSKGVTTEFGLEVTRSEYDFLLQLQEVSERAAHTPKGAHGKPWLRVWDVPDEERG